MIYLLMTTANLIHFRPGRGIPHTLTSKSAQEQSAGPARCPPCTQKHLSGTRRWTWAPGVDVASFGLPPVLQGKGQTQMLRQDRTERGWPEPSSRTEQSMALAAWATGTA